MPVIVLLVILLAPAAVAEPASDILDEVRTMLEAGISEPIILKWLDGDDRKPRRPSAADLIGLKDAGASDELLAKLLELAGVGAHGMRLGESPEPEPQPPAEPRAPVLAAAPVAPIVEPAAAPPVNASASSLPAAAGEVPVHFQLSYRPEVEEDDEEWGFYVYLDGEPLSCVPAATLLNAEPLSFRRDLTPGRHVLRVAQEQHEKRRRGRWSHAARIAKMEFPLELEADARADVELQFRQSQFARGRSGGPLSYRFAQGKSVETIEKQGGDPESWPLVCEEIEANAAPDRELSKYQRRQLEDCARWSEIWGDLEVPSRDAVREVLVRAGYRPIAGDQGLD